MGGALEGRVRGVSGVGPCSPGCRRQPETQGGGTGAALLHELPSSRGSAHFRVGPRGVRRPRQGPGGPQVSRGGRLPRPSRAGGVGRRVGRGPGRRQGALMKGPGRADNTGARGCRLGLRADSGSPDRGETPAGLCGVPAPPPSSRVVGGVRVP